MAIAVLATLSCSAVTNTAGAMDIVLKCEAAPISEAEVAGHIASDIEGLTPEAAADYRYLTLTNLLNACATPKEIALYRHAIVKLLNSLSWQVRPVEPQAIDPAGGILRVRLGDLGWSKHQWQRILQAYPYGLVADAEKLRQISKKTGSALPYLRADWFAYSAARPPLYYSLLGLPKTYGALQEKLGVNADENIRNFAVRRAAFALKTQARSRLIESHLYTERPFWTVYEFSGKTASQSIFNNPLGRGAHSRIRHSVATSLFGLPNGYSGYYLHNSKGVRLNASSLLPCRICNFSAPVLGPDEVRERVLANPDASPALKLRVSVLYAQRDEMQNLLDSDRKVWDAASKPDPSLQSETGIEPIRALSNRFAEKNVMLADAAAELGLRPDDLAQNLAAANRKAQFTGRILAQTGLPRREFEEKFKAVVEVATDMKPLRDRNVGRFTGRRSTVARPAVKRSGSFNLYLVSDKAAYRRGEAAIVSVQPQVACNLTVISVNEDGSGMVIFPNKFKRDPYLLAGQVLHLPDDFAPFRLRLDEAGEEKIVAYCNAQNRWSGVEHDFKTSPFTRIDDFQAYLELRKQKETPRSTSSGYRLRPRIARGSITFTVE